MRIKTTVFLSWLLGFLVFFNIEARSIQGSVELHEKPLVNAKVSLWKTQAKKEPLLISETNTDFEGKFKTEFSAYNPEGHIFYLTAKDSVNPQLELMSVLGTNPQEQAFVNELTTVASAFTNARFIDGHVLKGNALGLRIAASNVPNLVNTETGSLGYVITDPINSTENTTLAKLNTLASLITYFGTTDNQSWKSKFIEAIQDQGPNSPKTTLDAIGLLARRPWIHSKEIFELFTEAYPQSAASDDLKVPFAPFLFYQPNDFVLMLKFAGGGIYSAGKISFDAEGNVWSGQNWMPGSQSGVLKNIGGGTIKLSPSGEALSPAITGFRGMGVDGIGWGTAVTNNNVWVSSFNGSIGVMDFDGVAIGNASDFPLKGQTGNLMGIGVAPNGDVWIADGTKNQLLKFPNGELKKGKIVNVEGLKSPFGIVIDDQNRVWVSNSQADTVVRFPSDNPSKVETYKAGINVRGLALDSKGNLWVASNLSPGTPLPKIPDGVSIMKQFQLMLENANKNNKPTGVVNMIKPDGSQIAPKGFNANQKINVPWGVSIDGNDDVWVANIMGKSVVLLKGDKTSGHPLDAKTGDLIHVFQSGSIQMITDVSVDPAGNVWVANNWNDVNTVASKDPARSTSTWGGGSGIVVIYGVAAPVKTPLVGHVQKN